RITMFQGAPMPEELTTCDPDAWAFPVLPGQDEGSLAAPVVAELNPVLFYEGSRGSAGSFRNC
ncbi:MAG: hypothetical protein VX367_09160, partial [SAR324 cluster bacterium]|nr:hypothetical protein [SAR324 cluster bacterium]